MKACYLALALVFAVPTSVLADGLVPDFVSGAQPPVSKVAPVPAPAPKVQVAPELVAPVPFRPPVRSKPDSMGKTIARATGITIAVNGVMIGLRLGVLVLTGVAL